MLMIISIFYVAFPQHGHWRPYTACLIVTILHTDLFFMKFHTYLLILPKTVVAVPSDSMTGVYFLFWLCLMAGVMLDFLD